VDYGEWQAERCRKGLSFSMTTNGTLFDEEKLAFCQRHGIKFLLSIDGDEETHNAHRRFVAFRYDLRTRCHECDLKDDCAGGCPAVNYEATG